MASTLIFTLLVLSTLSLTPLGKTRLIDALILGATIGVVGLWLGNNERIIKSPWSIVVPLLSIWVLFLLSSITSVSSIPQSVVQSTAAIIISGVGVIIIPQIYSSSSFILHILLVSFILGIISVLSLVMLFDSVLTVELLRTVPYKYFILFGERNTGKVPVAGLGNPNTLAKALVPGILAGIYSIRKRIVEHSIWGVVAFGLVTIVPTVALVLTRSRGGLIALVAGIVMYAAIHVFSTDAVRALCIWGVVATLIVLVPYGIGPYPSIIELVSEPRTFLWRRSLDAILQRPFLGYGVGNSRLISPEQHTQPHNAYFMLGMWSGIGAMILYFYLFTQSLLLSVRKQEGEPAAIFPAILTSYWVITVFESVDIFHLTIQSVILAITIGFVAHSLSSDNVRDRKWI